jgi:SPP1 gp7 family putative phage head morphogenesis protein
VPSALTETAVATQLDHAAEVVGHLVTVDNVDRLIAGAGRRVDLHVARQLAQIISIDLRADVPGLQALIDRWRERNVSLITTALAGPGDGVRLKPVLEDVSDVIEDAHRNGLRVENLASELEQRYSVSRSRAELIARDQVLTLNGQINAHRQQAAGIESYRWITSRDERVRKSHQRLHGTVHRWDDPPSVGHPGDDIQCRCTASPILPGT